MTDHYTVEKNVPRPLIQKHRKHPAMPFEAMEVGDSFTFPPRMRNTVNVRAQSIRAGRRFSIRENRIWRTK